MKFKHELAKISLYPFNIGIIRARDVLIATVMATDANTTLKWPFITSLPVWLTVLFLFPKLILAQPV